MTLTMMILFGLYMLLCDINFLLSHWIITQSIDYAIKNDWVIACLIKSFVYVIELEMITT